NVTHLEAPGGRGWIRVAQWLERRCKPEMPVRPRPLTPSPGGGGMSPCEICGKPNATVAYFRTGMLAVVYHRPRAARTTGTGSETAKIEKPPCETFQKYMAQV